MKNEPKCIMDELPDRRIGMSAETHALCPKCHPQVYEKKQPQHTPTPNPHPEGHMDNCNCAWCGPKYHPRAARIVRAVNTHEDLLQALKELRDTVVRHNQEIFSEYGSGKMCDGVHDADKAIAKAEGK